MSARLAGATPHERSLEMTRILDAPRALVFTAWTDPRHLAKWWKPKMFTVPTCTVDLRVGGALRLCMRAPNGKDYWMRGIYREIDVPGNLVLSTSAEDDKGNPQIEGAIAVTFTDRDGRTLLRLETTMRGSSEQAAFMLAGMEPGWTQSLDQLAAHVAQLARVGD